jgi:hypothetical protein
MEMKNIKENFAKYGGWKSMGTLLAGCLLCIGAFVFYMLSTSQEGMNLFTGTTYTEDLIAALSPFYYTIAPIISFALILSFSITLGIGLLFGKETLMSIGIMGFGFSVCFLAGRTTLISIGGSVFPGLFGVGDYIMAFFTIAGIWAAIVAFLKSHFVETFSKPFTVLTVGIAFIILFNLIGLADLFGSKHPLYAISLILADLSMICLCFASIRTFRQAEKLIS